MFEGPVSRAVGIHVTIDGIPAAGALSLHLLQSGAFSADRFAISMALSGAIGASYYAGLSTALVSISITSGTGTGLDLIVGQVDNVTIDFTEQTALLTGRDLSARLIDAEVNQSFANQTASEIANQFALDAGLFPNTVQTQSPVGQYYELLNRPGNPGGHFV